MKSNTEINQKELAMKGRYRPAELRNVLNQSPWLEAVGRRETLGGIEQPFFYKNEHVIIFPPVTDTDKQNRMLETLKETLEITAAKVDPLELNSIQNKLLVFPVAEEQPMLFVIPRNHWVTLVYDPTTQHATVIDSRPQRYGYLYSMLAMQRSLTEGLARFNLQVNQFNVQYQAIQHDDIHCGAWTAMNLEALSQGASIDETLTRLHADEKEAVIEHLITLVHSDKKEFYYPRDATPTSSATNSNEDLVGLVSDDDAILVNKVYFDEAERLKWKETARILFENCFNSTRALTMALVARENLTYNNQKLKDDDLDRFNIEPILSDIQQKYPNLLQESLENSVPDYQKESAGYGLSNPRYILSKLKEIGFTYDELREMSLSDIIRYDAALYCAEANAGHHEALAAIQEQANGAEEVLKGSHDEHVSIQSEIAALLKQAVEKQQSREKQVNLVELKIDDVPKTEEVSVESFSPPSDFGLNAILNQRLERQKHAVQLGKIHLELLSTSLPQENLTPDPLTENGAQTPEVQLNLEAQPLDGFFTLQCLGTAALILGAAAIALAISALFLSSLGMGAIAIGVTLGVGAVSCMLGAMLLSRGVSLNTTEAFTNPSHNAA